MVRFKNRWLLVEFFQPDQHCPPSSSKLPQPQDLPVFELTGQLDGQLPDVDMAEEEEEDSPRYPTSSTIPFLAPNQPIFMTPAAQRLSAASTSNPAGKGKETALGMTPGKIIPEKQIYHALKRSIVDVFGDAGWGKVGNSLSVKYFSQTTSLCIIRVARDHFRIAWGGLSFMNELDGIRVIPRVIGCSGTLKKLYIRAESYTTLLIANYLSHTLSCLPDPASAAASSNTATESTELGKTATMMITTTREGKVRQAEVEAWKERREEVVKALRGVDEG